MKIQLMRNLPVGEQHGMTKGRICEVVRVGYGRGKPRWYVLGDAGEEVGVLGREANVYLTPEETEQQRQKRQQEFNELMQTIGAEDESDGEKG